jgi:hypothetical protein
VGGGVAMQRVLALDRFLSKVDFSNRKKKMVRATIPLVARLEEEEEQE